MKLASRTALCALLLGASSAVLASANAITPYTGPEPLLAIPDEEVEVDEPAELFHLPGVSGNRRALGHDYDHYHYKKTYVSYTYISYAKWVVKEINKYPDQLKVILGGYYYPGYYCDYVKLAKVYYVKKGHNYYYKLTIYVKYYGYYFYFDYYIYVPYHKRHYKPHHIYKISYKKYSWDGHW